MATCLQYTFIRLFLTFTVAADQYILKFNSVLFAIAKENSRQSTCKNKKQSVKKKIYDILKEEKYADMQLS